MTRTQNLTAFYTKVTKVAPIPRIYTPCYTKIKREGSLMVWWIPQIPMDSFLHPVTSIKEAKSILSCLAFYDLFQYENNIKPDYANAGGLLVYENDIDNGMEWIEWYDPETEDNIDNTK